MDSAECKKLVMKSPAPKCLNVGDCFEIPLSNGRYAYGRYLYWDDNYGPLCEIFSRISDVPIEVSKLDSSRRLFPPVYIGFGSVLSEGKWRVIGSLPIANFEFPHFRKSFGTKPGRYDDWIIYDGTKKTVVGFLEPEMADLEFLCGWSPKLLTKRIETGENRYDLIK
jgi:hypothetical protein